MNEFEQSIEAVSWESVKQQVKKVAYDIYETIERLDLTTNHKIYKVRYPYGAMIVGKGGICNIPNKDGILVPLTDISISKKMKDDLGYSFNAIPMSLILSGQVELFVENDLKEIETFGVYKAGLMLALRGVLDYGRSYQAKNFWLMTSGSRTLFSLASIFDSASFHRLKKYFNLSIDKSSIKQDVWPLFAALANNKEFPITWHTEHLFFGKEWLKPPKNDGWRAFRLALFERSWRLSAHGRNIDIVNHIWNLFKHDKKIAEHIFQMIKYVVEASLGQALLYRPVDNSNIAGPFTDFTDILLNVYGLKKYAPIIMCAGNFDFHDKYQGYVSIQKPCKQIAKNQYDNLIVVAREIRQMLMCFLDESARGIIKIDDTPFYDLHAINFDFYHSDEDVNKEFLPSCEIFSNDISVEKLLRKVPSSNREIPFRNDLLRSCIKISRK
jgi:hypothetical protein